MSERALSRRILAELGALPDVIIGHNPVGQAQYVSRTTGRAYVVDYGWPGPGGPDLIAVVHRRFLGLELKELRGTTSAEQRACHAALERVGARVQVVRSVDEAARAIEEARR